ncbi:MAG TPA: RcpC/CpaB family pilus assembly protein [Micromonosporaceae bacterium]|nr:RcpC/CpaB family pilus assembly protein [Micromonosporaceae bacterium]
MTRRILAILLATILAALGTAGVLFYVQRADDRAVADAAAVRVLVAKQRVPAGTSGETIRKREFVEMVRLPAASVPLDEALTDIPAELDKLVITSDLQPRQLLLRGMFSPSTRTSGGLPIPEGKMAVSFEATLAEQVAGFVRPGAQVAVFVSYREMKDGNGKAAVQDTGADDVIKGTEVLLPRVDVIAIGAREGGETTTAPLDGQAAANGEALGETVLVTVAVNQTEAAKIIHAADGKSIWLALLTDSSNVRPGGGVDSRTFLG